MRANVTIYWTVRENVRANLQVLVKRRLRRYGYPPDKQEKSTQMSWNKPSCEARHGLCESSSP